MSSVARLLLLLGDMGVDEFCSHRNTFILKDLFLKGCCHGIEAEDEVDHQLAVTSTENKIRTNTHYF